MEEGEARGQRERAPPHAKQHAAARWIIRSGGKTSNAYPDEFIEAACGSGETACRVQECVMCCKCLLPSR